MLEPVGGSLRRVIPIILAHHDKFDGSGYHPTSGEQHPDRGAHHLGGRRLRFADERSPLPQGDVAVRSARTSSSRARSTEFDPKVVAAFLKAFRQGELEMWASPLTAA